jgi:hypothetical protein
LASSDRLVVCSEHPYPLAFRKAADDPAVRARDVRQLRPVGVVRAGAPAGWRTHTRKPSRIPAGERTSPNAIAAATIAAPGATANRPPLLTALPLPQIRPSRSLCPCTFLHNSRRRASSTHRCGSAGGTGANTGARPGGGHMGGHASRDRCDDYPGLRLPLAQGVAAGGAAERCASAVKTS